MELSDLFTGLAKIWSIGPAVTLPIFTGGRHYFNLQSTFNHFEACVFEHHDDQVFAKVMQVALDQPFDFRPLAGLQGL